MERMMRWLMVWACLCAAGAAGAQDETVYGGCVDARGAAVPTLIDLQLPQAVATGIEAGRAVIRHNPDLLPRLLPQTRAFLVAQACARLNLGYPAQGELDATQARRVDCAALATLRRSGLLGEGGASELDADLRLSDEEWRWLPGPQRSFALATCGAERVPGRLQLGPTTESPAWNACVRACAAPLYRCQARCAAGECADCEAAYARCERACDAR